MANIFAQKPEVKIFPFKSAIIEYKYEAQLSGTHIKYIDDYGNKQADYIRKEINLGETEKKYETILIEQDKAYSLNFADTTVSLAKNNTYAYFFKYTDKSGEEIINAIETAASGWKQTGTIKFLDKDCKIWESGKSLRYTWNGIILYDELNFMVMMVETATKIQIDIKVPQEKFEIPQGYKYSENGGQQIGYSGLDLSFKTNNNINNNTEPTEEITEEASEETNESNEDITEDHEEISEANEEISEEENTISINVNYELFSNYNNFVYFDENGKVIEINGKNDYNRIDNTIIKSQDSRLLSAEQTLPRYSTCIFKTEKGLYGKLQIVEINDETFSYQFVIFNTNGTVKEYNEKSNDGLNNYFDIKPNERNSSLIITSKNKSKILTLK